MQCDLFEKHRDVLFDWLSQPINLWNGRQREKEEQNCRTSTAGSGVVYQLNSLTDSPIQLNELQTHLCIFPDDVNSDLLMHYCKKILCIMNPGQS